MNVFTLAPLFMAGIAFFVGFYHLLLYSRLKQQKAHLLFALACIVVVIYDILCTGLYNSGNLTEGISWGRWQPMALHIFALFFLWFAIEFTSNKGRKIPMACTIYYLAVTVVGLADLPGMFYDPTQTSIKVITLPFGTSITYYEFGPGYFSDIDGVISLATMVYVMWLAIHFYRSGHPQDARPLILVQSLFFIGAINDIIVASFGVYQFIYLVEYTYMAMVLFMTYVLSRSVVNSAVMEEVLQHHLDETIKISDMKSNLITFASHELKTPLVPIIGWVELIQKRLKEGSSLDSIIEKEDIDSIAHAADRLSKIVDNLLDVGRLEYGKIDLRKDKVFITDILANAIKEVQELAKARNITIENQAAKVQLNLDAFRIEEVIQNILSNAIKYSPLDTRVTITSEQNEEFYILSVRDQGYGFTAEELRNVWQPFSTTYLRKKNFDSLGTGVGLYLSKRFIALHGGKIEITSPGPDQGANVKIFLPL